MSKTIERWFTILFFTGGMFSLLLFCLSGGLDYWFEFSVMMFLIAIFLRGDTPNSDASNL